MKRQRIIDGCSRMGVRAQEYMRSRSRVHCGPPGPAACNEWV